MGINSLITYVFASRFRPEKFFSCLDNIKSYSASGNYLIIAAFDEDDCLMNNPTTMRRLSYYDKIVWFMGKSKGKIDAINREAYRIPNDTSIVICMSDDFEFIQQDYDIQIRHDMMKHFPDTDGVLHYPDQTPNGPRIMTMSIIGKKYFDRTGYIYNPQYKSVYADNEETEKAKMLGRYSFINKYLFIHRHWIFGFTHQDQLNEINDSEEAYKRDHAVYTIRKSVNFGI